MDAIKRRITESKKSKYGRNIKINETSIAPLGGEYHNAAFDSIDPDIWKLPNNEAYDKFYHNKDIVILYLLKTLLYQLNPDNKKLHDFSNDALYNIYDMTDRMVLGEDVYKYCKDLDDLGVKVEHLVYDFTK